MNKQPNSQLSLNDLIQLILLENLSDLQRRDLISAIRSVARLLTPALPIYLPMLFYFAGGWLDLAQKQLESPLAAGVTSAH